MKFKLPLVAWPLARTSSVHTPVTPLNSIAPGGLFNERTVGLCDPLLLVALVRCATSDSGHHRVEQYSGYDTRSMDSVVHKCYHGHIRQLNV